MDKFTALYIIDLDDKIDEIRYYLTIYEYMPNVIKLIVQKELTRLIEIKLQLYATSNQRSEFNADAADGTEYVSYLSKIHECKRTETIIHPVSRHKNHSSISIATPCINQ